jgi:uncharacterized SAM-binding protein YcdF (DUF218 family)
MLFLNKLMPIFVLPIGLVFLLLAVAWWRKKKWPAVVAASLLYASSIPFVGDRLAGWLEARYPAVPLAEAPRGDAVIVLGGIFGPETGEGFLKNLSESGERLEAGIRLHEQGNAPWLVFTGGKIPWERRKEVEGELARREAVKRGVPADRIVVTREVGNTWDEARAVAELMKKHGWKRIILVTSAWHMPRSARLFRKAEVEFAAFPVDFRFDRTRPLTLLDFLPKAESLADTERALRECYGIAFYALTGR